MKTTLGNQANPDLNHPKIPNLQNEELAPPSKSLGFRFCTYLVLFSFFFQTLWPSVAFAHVDVPLGADWRDAASGLTFTVQPFKDPTTHRNLVRLQAQINSKEEWAEQDVTPAKAPASKGSVLSSSLPAADNPSAEPLKKPINPSETARSALEEKIKTVLDRIVDIEALQPIPSSSTQIPYNDLSVTEDGIQWGFGGLKFVLDWNWNVLSSGRAEFDMALKVCTLGTVELDNLFVKQVLAKGRDVLFSGNGRIDRMDAWATGIQGVHARPGIVRIAKDSEQRFHQIFIHQGRGENFGNLHIEESLNQNEAFQNNSHMHMDRGASVKGGSVFTNTAILEGESYSVQSALIRNEGTGDQKAVMQATDSLTLVAPKLEQKGLLKSPEVDLLGVQQIEDSVDSLIDVDLLKTQLTQTWTQTGTIDAGEWQDTSTHEVFIQNKGGIKTYNETSISARFRTLQGGKSDLSGVSLLNPLDRDRPLENEGEGIFRHAKDLGGNPRAIQNGAGASLVILDSDSIGILSLFNRGHVVLWDGGYRVGVMDNEGGTLQVERLHPLDDHLAEWILTGDISVQSLHVAQEDSLQKIIQRSRLKCGSLRLKVSDFLGEPGSELIIGVPGLEPKASQFEVKTFLSQGRVQSLVPLQGIAKRSIKIPGPMTLEQPTTFQTPILETESGFTALAPLTLKDCYWTHQKGPGDIAQLLFEGLEISIYADMIIREMGQEDDWPYPLNFGQRTSLTIPIFSIGRGSKVHIQKGGADFGTVSNYGEASFDGGTYRLKNLNLSGTLEVDELAPYGSEDLILEGTFGGVGRLHAKRFHTYLFHGSKIINKIAVAFDRVQIEVDTLANQGEDSSFDMGGGHATLKTLENDGDIILRGDSRVVTDSLQNGDGIVQSPNDHLQVLILDPDQPSQTRTYGPSLRVNFKDKTPNAEQTHDNLRLGGLKAQKDLIIEMDKCLHPAQCLHLFGRNLQCGGWLKIYGDTFRTEQDLTYLGALFLKVRLLQDEGHHLVFRELQVETQKARLRNMAFIETKPDDKNPTAGTSLSITCEEDLDLKAVQLFGDGPVTVESTKGDTLVGDKGDIIPSQLYGVSKYGSNGSWLASNKTISVGGKNVRLTWADIRTYGHLILTAQQLVELVGSRAFAQLGITLEGQRLSHRFDHIVVNTGMWHGSDDDSQGYIKAPLSDPSSLQTFGNIHLEIPQSTILGSYMLAGGFIISEHGICWKGLEGCPFVHLENHTSYGNLFRDLKTSEAGIDPDTDLPQHFHAKVQAGKGVKIETPDLRSSGSISGFTMNLKAQRAEFQFIGHVLQALQKAGITSLEPFIRSLVSPTGFIREQTDGTISPFRPAPPSAVLIPRHTLPVIEDLDEIGRPSTSYTFLVEPSSVLELQGLQSMLSSLMGGYYEGLSIQDIYKRFIRNGQKALQEGALIDTNAVHYGLPLLFYMESKLKEAEKRKEKPKSLYLYVPPQLQQIAESAAVRSHETMTILGEDHLEGMGATFEATGPGADVNLLVPNGEADLKPFIQTVGDMADYQQVARRTKIRAARDAIIKAKTIKTSGVQGKAGRDILRIAEENNINEATPLYGQTIVRKGGKRTTTQTTTHVSNEWQAGRKDHAEATTGVLYCQGEQVQAKEAVRAFKTGFYDVGVNNETRVESTESRKSDGPFGGSKTIKEQEFISQFQPSKIVSERLTLIDLGGDAKVVLQGVDWSQVSKLVLDCKEFRVLAGRNAYARSSFVKSQNVAWQSVEMESQTSHTFTAAQLPDPENIEFVSEEEMTAFIEKVQGQTLSWVKAFDEQAVKKGGRVDISELVPEHTYTHFEQGGPTAAAALVVAIAITVCTAGAMSAAGAAVATSVGLGTAATATAAATLTTAGMVVQGLTVVALQSLALSAANSIMYNTNDFGKALSDFVKSDTWKGAAKAVAFKGLDVGMGPIFSKVAIGMIENKKMGDIVKGIVVDEIAKGLAAQISKAGLSTVTYKIANTALAAGTGAVSSKDHEKGALDAALAANIGMFVGDIATDNPAQIGRNAAARASRENIHPNLALDREAADQMNSSMNIARVTTAIAAMLAERDVTLCDGVVSNILQHRCTAVLKELASASPEFQEALRAEEARTAQVPSSIPVEPAEPKKMKAKPPKQSPHEKEESAQEKAKKPRTKAKGRQQQAREQVDPKETLDHLDQTLQGLDGVQDGLTGASFGASGFNPSETTKTRRHVPDDIDPGYESDTTKRNRIRLRKAEADYEAVKDQGFRARYGKGEELFDARMTYEERIDLRQSLNAADRTSRQTARVVIDAAHYVKENPLEAAGIAAAVALTAGGAAVGGLAGVAMGMAGGGLGGLAANHYKVENAQDALNIGASAATGAFAPAKGIKALAAGMGVGAGIGAAGYATGSTPMMVDGAILGASAALGAGRHFVRALASKAPMAGAQNARKFYAFDDSIINTSANRNMVPPSVGFQFGQVPQRQAANTNLVEAIAQRAKATGTHGPEQSFGPRMMSKDDLDLPRRFGGLGHTSSGGVPGVSAPTRAAPSAPKSAVNPQGAAPKKDVRFGEHLPDFSKVESEIVHEARTIFNSDALSKIKVAHESGKSVTVNIGGRVVQYEPGLPPSISGMTMFGENGFLIGPNAFKSNAELGKTILHELHRLKTSASAMGVSGELASLETKSAFDFAEKAIKEIIR